MHDWGDCLTWSKDHGLDAMLLGVPMYKKPKSFLTYSSLWLSRGRYTESSVKDTTTHFNRLQKQREPLNIGGLGNCLIGKFSAQPDFFTDHISTTDQSGKNYVWQ